MIIQAVNKYNYVNFSSRKVPASVTKIADSELKNESVLLDIKIKEFLQDIINKNTPLGQRKIASELGLSFESLRHRIVTNKELKALADKIIDASRVKSEDINKKIKIILEELIESETPSKIEDIAKKAEISNRACFRRINEITELKELWKNVKRAPTVTKSDESLNIDLKIKEILEKAVLNNSIILKEDIAKAVGLTTIQVKGRIRNTPALKELWDKLEHYKYPKKNDKSKEKDSILKEIMAKALDNNALLSLSDVVEQTGLTIMACKHRIMRNPTLKELWLKVKDPKRMSRVKTISGDDKEALINKIQSIMELAKTEGKILTLEDVANVCNTRKNIIQHIIYSNSELKNLWNQIAHGRISKNDSQELNLKIEKVLRSAIDNKTPMFIDDIAKELNVSRQTISGRLTVSKELNSLWEQTPRKRVLYKPQSSEEKTEKIKNALEGIISEARSITIKELAQEIGLEYLSLKDKIKRTPVLKSLWNQIERKTVSDDSVQINNSIKEVLTGAIKDKTYISCNDVAKMAGLTNLTCMARLKTNSELSMLWEQVQQLKTDDVNTLNTRIKDIIQESINSNTMLEIEDIVNKIGISGNSVKYRIHRSKELEALWNEVKNIDNRNLQQLHYLKKKNANSDEIMKKLNLSEEKFSDLNKKYNEIKSLLLNRFGEDTLTDEFLDWAFLSKREFELSVNQIFSKMGYQSNTTRFCVDNGIDIVAKRDGKTTFVECMHNLYSPASTEELFILQANKDCYNADEVIFVATSGITSYGQEYAQSFKDTFKVLDLKDIIQLAKKYNVDITKIKEKRNINLSQLQGYGGNWILAQKSDPIKTEQLRKMKQEQFEKIVTDLFESKGYAVKKANELNIDGYYLVIKGNHKSLIKCHNQDSVPTADSVKALYGLKDFYKADDVILIGAPCLSPQSKIFIDKINKNEQTKNTYKIISIDKVIDALDKN